MALNCNICKKAIRAKQNSLECKTCKLSFHRICLPTMKQSIYHNVKNNWNCDECITKSNLNIGKNKQKCNTCTRVIFTNIICFHCNFPSPKVHEIFSTDEYDYSLYLPFLFKEKTFPKFEKGIRVGHLNVNSLTNKYHEVSDFLTKFKFDIFACTETKLNNHYTNGMLIPENYQILRQDRHAKRGGGTLLYIRNDHKYCIANFDVAFPEFVEVHALKIFPKFRKPLICISIYKPPKTNNEAFLSSFEALVSNLNKENDDFMILGDLNIDLIKNKKYSKELKSMIKTLTLKQLINNPTRTTDKSSTLIDHIYIPKSMNRLVRQSGNFILTESDHDCIFSVLNYKKIKFPPKIIQSRNFKKTDWKAVTEKFEQIDFNILIECPIQDIYNEFLLTIDKLINEIAPFKKKRIKDRNNKWLTSELLKLYKKRDECRHEAKITNNLELTKYYKCIRNTANIATKHAKKTYFTDKFKGANDCKKIWNTYNELTGKSNQAKDKIQSLQIDNKTCDNKDAIANNFAKAFVVKGPDESDKIIKFKDEILTSDDDFQIDSVDVCFAIRSLNTKPDNHKTDIPYTFLSKLDTLIAKPIALIFNRMLNESHIPIQLKKAIISPVYKCKGSKEDASSYRPISVLPIFDKIFEKVLHKKLSTDIENAGHFDDNQHGFRKGRSCQTALNQFTSKIQEAIGKPNNKVGVVFVDLQLAYNHIPYFELLKILKEKYNVSGKILKILCEYFIERKFTIKLGSFESKPFDLHIGLPQGNIIGSLLFNCYYNEVSKSLLNAKYCLFADDLAFYLEDTSEVNLIKRLESILDSLNEWCGEMKLSINFNKTKFMVFHKPQISIDKSIQLKHNNIIIERVNSFKYLGLYLDEKLNYDTHYDHVINKISSALGCINTIRKYITEQMFVIIINAFVLSIIDYGLQIWGCISTTKLNALQNKINNAIKVFFYPNLSKLHSKQLWSSNDPQSNKTKANLRKLNRNIDMNNLLEKCNMLSIEERYHYYMLLEVSKIMKNDFKINSLKVMFSMQDGNNSLGQRLKTYLCSSTSQKSFRYRATKAWNELPVKIRNFNISTTKFKFELTKHLLNLRK